MALNRKFLRFRCIKLAGVGVDGDECDNKNKAVEPSRLSSSGSRTKKQPLMFGDHDQLMKLPFVNEIGQCNDLYFNFKARTLVCAYRICPMDNRSHLTIRSDTEIHQTVG